MASPARSVEADVEALFNSQSSTEVMSADDLEQALSRSDDEISAMFVGQSDLGDPGLNSSRARLALADADTAQEKINAFKKIYPDGDLQVTPVTGELVFREDSSKPFAKVDAGILEKFEPVNDIIDFLGGDIGAIAGELAFSKGTGSLIGFLGRMFLGGSAGELVQQEVQTARDVQEQTRSEQFEQAGQQGTISLLGGGAGRLIGGGVDIMRGGPSVSLAPGADEAIRAGNRLGLKRNLTVGESTDVPLLKKIEGQSSASLPTVSRYIEARNEELTGIVTGMTDPRQSRGLIEALAREERREQGRALSVLGKSTPKTRLTEGGEALNTGIAQYSRDSQRRVTQAYEYARSIEEPQFDITTLKGDVDSILEGVKFQTVDGTVERAGSELDNAVAEIARQIKSADPTLPTVVTEAGEATSVDQLRA